MFFCSHIVFEYTIIFSHLCALHLKQHKCDMTKKFRRTHTHTLQMLRYIVYGNIVQKLKEHSGKHKATTTITTTSESNKKHQKRRQFGEATKNGATNPEKDMRRDTYHSSWPTKRTGRQRMHRKEIMKHRNMNDKTHGDHLEPKQNMLSSVSNECTTYTHTLFQIFSREDGHRRRRKMKGV